APAVKRARVARTENQPGTASCGQSVHRPSHDHVKFATRRITAQLVECRPLVAFPGSADAMILVDPDDLAAHPTRDLAQLAFLIGRSLIDRTDAEIENRSEHSLTLPRGGQRKDAMRRTDRKSRVCMGFRQD